MLELRTPNDPSSAKFDVFLSALRALCEQHEVTLSTSGHDGLQVWDRDPKNEDPLHANGIDDMTKDVGAVGQREGYHALWEWFELSYASWLTIPRILMHAMPDPWQSKMAALMEEYDATWTTDSLCEGTLVTAVGKRNKFVQFPDWLLNYRHPDTAEIDNLRKR